MFLNSQIVLVDDKDHHLTGIKEALNSLRIDCHSIKYEDESIGDLQRMPRVRFLLIDKNLRDGGTMGGGDVSAFSAIAEVISLLIDPTSGPYGIILWAEEPDIDGLKKFLFERFQGEEAPVLPVFFAALPKAEYINTGDGSVINAEKLKTDIISKLSENPQLKAMMSWEADVSIAVDAVMRSIVGLVPDDVRSTDVLGEKLGEVLFRLSQAGGGVKRAKENPREAINRVLVPILADRVTEHDPQGDAHDNWVGALSEPRQDASLVNRGALNSAIHISFAKPDAAVPIKATDLGAVVSIKEDAAKFLGQNYGVREEFFWKEFLKLNQSEWADCSLRLVQIGAACDQAQPKLGGLLYLLALEWNCANANGTKEVEKPNLRINKNNPGFKNVQDQIWRSPALDFKDGNNVGQVIVFKNFPLNLSKSDAERLIPQYRFREELISQLTQEYSRHLARPGIVEL